MDFWFRRAFERMQVKVPVVVDAGNRSKGVGLMFDSIDISPIGVKVLARTPLAVGTNVIVRAILPSSQRCQAQGVVWRRARNGMVVKFDCVVPSILAEFSYNGYSSDARPLLSLPA